MNKNNNTIIVKRTRNNSQNSSNNLRSKKNRINPQNSIKNTKSGSLNNNNMLNNSLNNLSNNSNIQQNRFTLKYFKILKQQFKDNKQNIELIEILFIILKKKLGDPIYKILYTILNIILNDINKNLDAFKDIDYKMITSKIFGRIYEIFIFGENFDEYEFKVFYDYNLTNDNAEYLEFKQIQDGIEVCFLLESINEFIEKTNKQNILQTFDYSEINKKVQRKFREKYLYVRPFTLNSINPDQRRYSNTNIYDKLKTSIYKRKLSIPNNIYFKDKLLTESQIYEYINNKLIMLNMWINNPYCHFTVRLVRNYNESFIYTDFYYALKVLGIGLYKICLSYYNKITNDNQNINNIYYRSTIKEELKLLLNNTIPVELNTRTGSGFEIPVELSNIANFSIERKRRIFNKARKINQRWLWGKNV